MTKEMGTYTMHGDKVVGRACTLDAAMNRACTSTNKAKSKTECDCAACKQRHAATRDSKPKKPRTIADVNAANRKAFGQR